MTQDNESPTSKFDWRMTSFEGACREQLRRWARLPLEQILLAIEEVQDIAHMSGAAPLVGRRGCSRTRGQKTISAGLWGLVV